MEISNKPKTAKTSTPKAAKTSTPKAAKTSTPKAAKMALPKVTSAPKSAASNSPRKKTVSAVNKKSNTEPTKTVDKVNVAPTTSNEFGLAEKQLAFCQAYIALGGKPNQAVAAAAKADYGSPNKRSNELLKNPNVIKYLQKLDPKVELPQALQKKSPGAMKIPLVSSTAGSATRDDLQTLLLSFAQNSKISVSERILAIEALSQMNGWSKKSN